MERLTPFQEARNRFQDENPTKQILALLNRIESVERLIKEMLNATPINIDLDAHKEFRRRGRPRSIVGKVTHAN